MASAKVKQIKNKQHKNKGKQGDVWKNGVNWSAAGRAAAATRRANSGKVKKPSKIKKPSKVVKTQKIVKTQKKVQKPQVKQHGKKRKLPSALQQKVNRDSLVNALNTSKKKEFLTQEVMSLAWMVIKNAKASANNGAKRNK
jgi:hypothetical protein